MKYHTAADAIRCFNSKISSRALGWDTQIKGGSAGKYFSPNSFGHLAFTGPSIWVDPEKYLIVTFLCNRTHPDPQHNKMTEFRPALHDLIYLSLDKSGLFN